MSAFAQLFGATNGWSGAVHLQHPPVNVHLLGGLRGFVVRHFDGHSEYDDEGYDPAGDVDRGVCLIHARVVDLGRDGRRGGRLHPGGFVVVVAGNLVQLVLLVLAAEAQVARPAAVPVVRVVALETLVVLAAHVVVPQAGVVVAGRRGLLRGDGRHRGGFGSLSGGLFGFLAPRRGAQDAQRIQIYEQQQKVANPHGGAEKPQV